MSNRQAITGVGGDGVENLLHRVSATCAKIKGAAIPASKQAPYCCNMRIGEVRDMNVVANGGAIGGWIIAAEHRKIVDMTLDRHHGSRNEMGFRIAEFTEFACRIGAARVEIAKSNGTNLMGPLIVRKNAFDHGLRGAVGVNRNLRRALADGNFLGFAIDGTGT